MQLVKIFEIEAASESYVHQMIVDTMQKVLRPPFLLGLKYFFTQLFANV